MNNFNINNDGNVGIGINNPIEKLEVNGNIKFGDGHFIGDSASDDLVVSSSSGEAVILKPGDVNTLYCNNNQDVQFFGTGGSTVKMFWDASLEALGIGTTSIQTDSIISTQGDQDGLHHHYFFNASGVGVGRITCTASTTSYVTSSDYRLKENLVDITGATERLKQLQPKRFNFIADADTTVDGFLAHEVSDIVPEAITGTKDEVDADGNPIYQGIDQSKLVPLLTASLKEAIAKIEELETRIATLEGN